MGSFTQNSQIEFYRRRRHGIASRFRFLKDSEDGYVFVGELTVKFYLTRKKDTETGARIEYLVFDAPDGFDRSILDDGVFGDLVSGDGTFKRYSVTTETEPTAIKENRWRCIVTAAFNDTTPIAP